MNRFRAVLLGMGDQPLLTGRSYLIRHATEGAFVSTVHLCPIVDPANLDRRTAATLELNEFGEVELETNQSLCFDPFQENQAQGTFIVVDPIGNGTLAAGMISTGDQRFAAETCNQAGLTVWLTGLSSAGKTTISKAVDDKLRARGFMVECLDGDVVRKRLNIDLGFSKADRDENVRRIGCLAELLTRNRIIVLVSAISPYRAIRDDMRRRIGDFLEIYVHAPLEVCMHRDVKALYSRAMAGEIQGVTGLDDPYEPPEAPEVECNTDRETVAQSAAKVLRAVDEWLSNRK